MVRAPGVGDQPRTLRRAKWDVTHFEKSMASPVPWQTRVPVSHPFRQLSQQEYDRLSLDEKLAYLQMLMGDIREKTDETRRAIEARKKLEGNSEDS
jgi:hypothetical protein